MKILLAFFLIISLSYCGGAATIPPSELPSVQIGDTTLTEGQITSVSVIPGSITFSYEDDLDSSTVTEDNITLACEGSETFTLDTESSSTAFTLTPDSPFSQKDICSITLGSELSFASISQELSNESNFMKAFSDDYNYLFSTPCASTDITYGWRDEFNSTDTISECWTQTDLGADVLTPDLSSSPGSLVFSSTTDDAPWAYNFYSQDFSTLPSNAILEVKISEFNNFYYGSVESDPEDGITIGIGNSNIDGAVACLVRGNAGSGLLFVAEEDDSDLNTIRKTEAAIGNTGDDSSDVTGGEPLFIQLTKTDNSYQCAYRIGESGAFTNVGSALEVTTVSDDLKIIFGIGHRNTSEATTSKIDYVKLLNLD